MERPSTRQNEEKLGYVVVLERWGWMLGTGIYLDDVNQALQRIDAAAQANIRDMFAWSPASPPSASWAWLPAGWR